MRISSDTSDPGHVPDFADWMVLFHGVPQSADTGRRIVTADEATGLIVFNRLDKDGTPEREWIAGEYRPKRHEERGRVFVMRRLDKDAPGVEPVMPPCDTEPEEDDGSRWELVGV